MAYKKKMKRKGKNKAVKTKKMAKRRKRRGY